jgi:hypothetical protein
MISLFLLSPTLKLAVLGHIVTSSGFRVGGDIAFGVPYSSMKAGLAAFDTIPAAGLLQIFIFIGLLETGFAYAEKDIADDSVKRFSCFNTFY